MTACDDKYTYSMCIVYSVYSVYCVYSDSMCIVYSVYSAYCVYSDSVCIVYMVYLVCGYSIKHVRTGNVEWYEIEAV